MDALFCLNIYSKHCINKELRNQFACPCLCLPSNYFLDYIVTGREGIKEKPTFNLAERPCVARLADTHKLCTFLDQTCASIFAFFCGARPQENLKRTPEKDNQLKN